MRLVLFFAALTLIASCGKDSGSSSSSRAPTTEREAEAQECLLNGRAVACESIRGADGLGVDILESMVDAPIEVSGTTITFLADKSSTQEGRRITCPTAVRKGEVYTFALRGDSLLISTEAGQFEMKRLNESQGLMGAWAWKGYVDEGTHVIRQMSFLSQNRVVMRTSCEL